MEALSFIIHHQLKEELQSHTRYSGGCVNQVYRCKTNIGIHVVKLNDSDQVPLMFSKEIRGLNLLGESPFRTPQVRGTGEFENWSYLIIECIENAGSDLDPILFGKNLAKMHQMTADSFGLDHDNFIGSMEQINKKHINWSDFYTSQRLEPLVRKAYDKGHLNNNELQLFEVFYRKLKDLVPQEEPALLHGDLWQGNLIHDESSNPVLIDPAVYYGHREMDLSMLELFGNVSESTMDAYQQVFPLEKHWEERKDVHQLYPVLVHLLLFGESYLQSIQYTLKKYA
jgi:fructosamine-3-kinase